MKIDYIFCILIVMGFAVLGCEQALTGEAMGKDSMMEKEAMREDGALQKDESMMEDEDSAMKEKEEMMESPYTGKVLAGTASKYLEFSKADYDKALKENKKILLYFYASWCPICRSEQPETFAAFDELNDPDLIGFRVNYRDGDDDGDEKELARQFGVAYQHTKVILKDGKQAGKYPDSWSRQTYLNMLEKVQ